MLWSNSDFGGRNFGWTPKVIDVEGLYWAGDPKWEEHLGSILKVQAMHLQATEKSAFGELGRLIVLKDPYGHLAPTLAANPPRAMDTLVAALAEPDRALVLRTALEALGVDQWAAKLTVSRAVERYLTRTPVAPGNLAPWLAEASG